MSLEGTATGKTLVGSINKCDVLTISAYGVAVQNGFKGTVEEWLASLKGKDATNEQIAAAVNAYFAVHTISPARLSEVTLLATAWNGSGNLHSQVVTVDGITPYSKVDLLPSVEQLAIFHNKDVAFVTENEDGVVTIYAIGDKPMNDYTIQVQITEVTV